MNFDACLKLGANNTASCDKEYPVVGCTVHLCRRHNTLHPNSKPVCERLEVTVVAPDHTDLKLQEWFQSHHLQSGSIEYEIQDLQNSPDISKRHIHFEDAQCFSYHEHYDIKEKSLRLLTLEIFPKVCTVDDTKFIAE
ncbi:MAG: type VI secretion system tube protein TssD [Bacteroidales bacterium]|nr:type VI secretion system tube protein TssD [Bacteroidales bacterium]